MDFDYDMALNIATGFGGGMGRLQETCGAVTGAFMVIGIYCSNKYRDSGERKDKSYSMIREFAGKFTEIHGTTSCSELLGCDLLTEEGMQKMISESLHESICEQCVIHSVGLLEALMEDGR